MIKIIYKEANGKVLGVSNNPNAFAGYENCNGAFIKIKDDPRVIQDPKPTPPKSSQVRPNLPARQSTSDVVNNRVPKRDSPVITNKATRVVMLGYPIPKSDVMRKVYARKGITWRYDKREIELRIVTIKESLNNSEFLKVNRKYLKMVLDLERRLMKLWATEERSKSVHPDIVIRNAVIDD